MGFMERLLDEVEVEWKALGGVAEYSKTRVDAAEFDRELKKRLQAKNTQK